MSIGCFQLLLASLYYCFPWSFRQLRCTDP